MLRRVLDARISYPPIGGIAVKYTHIQPKSATRAGTVASSNATRRANKVGTS